MKRTNSLCTLGVFVATFLGAAIGVAPAQNADDALTAHWSYQPVMQTGFLDANGHLVAGTEVMHLVPHQGKLYASTSLWMESDPSIPKAAQILVLDSPKAQWRVEHQFTKSNLRYGSLREVTFSTDATGQAIAPVTLLLAAPDVIRAGLKVYCRDDVTGDWPASEVGPAAQYATSRAVGLHRDRVTGIDRIFAGVGTYETAVTDKLGTFGGVYDPQAPGRIRWDQTPEFQTPAGERVMGYCDCNGLLYCATSHHIYQRTAGAAPVWKEIYFCPEEINACGIRGLSAVPHPLAGGEELLFAALSKVRRLDPADNFKETVELDIREFLTRQLGVKVTYVLAAYNEFLPCTLPSGETAWMFGFECCHPEAVVNAHPRIQAHVLIKENKENKQAPKHVYFAGDARYCVRRAHGADIRYDLAEITDPRHPLLVSTRTIAVSPFAEDHRQALYFGGFDCNYVPSHNTGWIYRAELPPR
jgi:hypothetical protein